MKSINYNEEFLSVVGKTLVLSFLEFRIGLDKNGDHDGHLKGATTNNQLSQ